MTDAGSVLSGLAIFTLFRGEPRQLEQWCNFHLNAGADRLYVVLDRPPAGLVDTLPSHPRVHWLAVSEEEWDRLYPRNAQTLHGKRINLLRRVADAAVADGVSHLASIDGDELLLLDRPFSEVARELGEATALVVPAVAMWRAAGSDPDEPFGASLALAPPNGNMVGWNRALGWRAQFLSAGFAGSEGPKTIYRLPLAAGDLTVHEPISGSLRSRARSVPTGRVLRYDGASFASWRHKWRARQMPDAAVADGDEEQDALQRMFGQMLRLDAAIEASAYRRFHELDETSQEALSGLGLLTRTENADSLTGQIDLADASWPPPAPPPTDRRVDFQFALVCDQRFVKPTLATMLTVVQHLGVRGSMRFVVLGDGIEARDIAYLKQLERAPYDVEVRVHDITAELDRDIGTEDEKRATFGRIYLIDRLPPQRTLYLDGDVLATRDFSEVFGLDLGDACLAGIPDAAGLRLGANPERVPLEQRNRLLGITDGDPLEYLNGGVLIFDLDHPDFRELALAARSLVFRFGPTLKQRDQDAMNLAFAGRKYRLPHTLNYMTQFYLSDRALDGDLTRLKYAAADATLIHFSGKTKPWIASTDEFYNGLYRRLVTEAEEALGVSCDFYFSPPRPSRTEGYESARWAAALTSARTPHAGPGSDVEILDISPSGVYLRLSPEMFDLAVTEPLRLVASAASGELFDLPLSRVSQQLNHLGSRVAHGVRKLPVDLASHGMLARDVEFRLVAGEDTRTLRVMDAVALGCSDTSALGLIGADGALELISDGRELSGWFRRTDWSPADAVALQVNGELVAIRRPARRRPGLPHTDARGFVFNLARLEARGYLIGDLTVTVAGTGIPLRGSPVPLEVALRGGTFDPGSDSWSHPSGDRPMATGLRRLARIAGRLRG